MTDSTGTVVWAATYDPFGKATVTVSQITNSLRFPGQYYDAETGLHYNWFRYYDPETGRYVGADPIGLWGNDFNLYGYCLDDPINFSDPSGLWRLCVTLSSEKTDWKTIWQEKHPGYSVLVTFADIFGARGTARWAISRLIEQARYVIKHKYCCEWNQCDGLKCKKVTDPPQRETRLRINQEVHYSDAWRIYQGGDVEGGDAWWATNPITGETVTGRMDGGTGTYMKI